MSGDSSLSQNLISSKTFSVFVQVFKEKSNNADSPVGEQIGIIAKLTVTRMRCPDSIDCQ